MALTAAQEAIWAKWSRRKAVSTMTAQQEASWREWMQSQPPRVKRMTNRGPRMVLAPEERARRKEIYWVKFHTRKAAWHEQRAEELKILIEEKYK